MSHPSEVPAPVSTTGSGERVATGNEPVFLAIQALRGIAACMVVLFHTSINWSAVAVGDARYTWWAGRAGVDIFFTISGFVMAITAMDRQGWVAAARFLERRLLRLMPLYWIATTVLLFKIVVIGSVHSLGKGAYPPWSYIVCCYLLIPWRHPTGGSHPLLETGWTLSFELLFYLCFALALSLRRKVAPFLTLVLSALVLAGLFHRPSWPGFLDLADPLLLEFLAGVWIGRSVKTRKTVPPRFSAALGCLGLLILVAQPALQTIAAIRLSSGIAAILIVNAAVVLERWFASRLPRWLLLVGDSSYSLYLTHLPLLGLYVYLLRRAHIFVAGRVRFADEAAGFAFCLLASILVGIVTYRWLEKPIAEWARRHARLTRPLQADSITG